MTEEEYLNAIIKKNPAIGRPDAETVTLTARGMRAVIRQAFTKGFEHGREIEKTMQNLRNNRSDPFSGFFGGRR